MKVFKAPKVSITAGLLVSLIVMSHLLSVALEWRLEPDPTLMGFLSDPTRFMFVAYIAVLLSCIWLVRGSNNRLMYTFWCLGYSIHYLLYWAGLEIFLYDTRNIYALNWLATASTIPLLLLCRYRNYLVIHVIAVMIRYSICKKSAVNYFNEIKSTDFEGKLRRGASCWFALEFTFASFLTLFAVTHDLGFGDSLKKAITESGLANPFPIYRWILNAITAYFATLILVNSIRDYKSPDWQSSLLLSATQRKNMIKGRKPSRFDPF